MSLDSINQAFLYLTQIDNLSVQLINVKNNNILGTQYSARKIDINDFDLATLLMEISRLYTAGKKNIFENYKEVRNYDGTAEATSIYRFSCDNPLICNEYQSLINEVSSPELEEDPFRYNSAYLIMGEIPNVEGGDNKNRVIFVSCINPVTSLKTKYRFCIGITGFCRP